MIEELKNMGLVTPIFTLIGVLIGTFLSFTTAWVLKSRETRLKISSQIIEKRIEAHEKILSLAKSMRAIVCIPVQINICLTVFLSHCINLILGKH